MSFADFFMIIYGFIFSLIGVFFVFLGTKYFRIYKNFSEWVIKKFYPPLMNTSPIFKKFKYHYFKFIKIVMIVGGAFLIFIGILIMIIGGLSLIFIKISTILFFIRFF